MSIPEQPQQTDGAPHEWKGLAELDRALAENRLTEYRIKKAWADPIERYSIIAIFLIVVIVFGYLAFSSLAAN
jgi:hypothetical protein